MGSFALVCEEGSVFLAFLRPPLSPQCSWSKLAGRGHSSFFPLQLGSGQTRKRLPNTLYPCVCQRVPGISAPVPAPPGWKLFWMQLRICWGTVRDLDPCSWYLSISRALGANQLCFFDQFFWVERSREASSSFDPLSLRLGTTPLCDRWLHRQHVCYEPGPLSALSWLQAEGPPGTATPGPLHNRGGAAFPRLLSLISSQWDLRSLRFSACPDSSPPRPACPQVSVLPSNQGGSHSPRLRSGDWGEEGSWVRWTQSTLFLPRV